MISLAPTLAGRCLWTMCYRER